MAERSRGMGRGLAAILSSTTTEEADVEYRTLPVDLIAPNPNQPRKHFGEEALVGLSASVRERGLLQPVLVRPVAGGTYELIAGERRWRAAQLAELEAIPAIVRPHDDAQSLELALIENMAREDLNPVEEARAVAALVEELGLSKEEAGRRLGRSRVAISNLLRLLDLPDEALELIESGRLTQGHGRALLTAPDHDLRRRLARDAAAQGWSVRQTEARCRAPVHEPGVIAVRRQSPELHPDQADAAERLGEAFGRALGVDVKITPRADGYRVQFAFESLDEALEAAERLGLTTPA
ncbi:MAG: ParB/RepB/Spo0J family partition protein [Solirubrobacteraceae bacterium]